MLGRLTQPAVELAAPGILEIARAALDEPGRGLLVNLGVELMFTQGFHHRAPSPPLRAHGAAASRPSSDTFSPCGAWSPTAQQSHRTTAHRGARAETSPAPWARDDRGRPAGARGIGRRAPRAPGRRKSLAGARRAGAPGPKSAELRIASTCAAARRVARQ